jgi:hypothetical protein
LAWRAWSRMKWEISEKLHATIKSGAQILGNPGIPSTPLLLSYVRAWTWIDIVYILHPPWPQCLVFAPGTLG